MYNNWVIEVWVQDATVSEIDNLIKRFREALPSSEGIVISARKEKEVSLYV